MNDTTTDTLHRFLLHVYFGTNTVVDRLVRLTGKYNHTLPLSVLIIDPAV